MAAHQPGTPEQIDAPGLWRGVGYRIGAHRLASGFDEVVEILPMPPVTPVPGAQSWVLGVANIRGSLLPIVDLKQFLEGERTVLMRHWYEHLETYRSGEPVVSPELTLRCKDGSRRIARGTMTVSGDDVIVAWTDLTEIRRNEQALRDSEQRFRSMVEQTISGIFVRRERHFIYVNPRFAEIMGYPTHELIGQDTLRFVVLDEIGRGTATYDGLAIAWAVAEALHDRNRADQLTPRTNS